MDAEVRRAYAVLELSPPVSADGLKRQYRKLAKRWHPDRHASDPVAQADAADRMRRINDAFRLVASINRSNEWTVWPRMSRERWYSLGAVGGYLGLTALLPRPVARIMALGILFAWIPMSIIWMAESELLPADARRWLRWAGWGSMALPVLLGLLTWLS